MTGACDDILRTGVRCFRCKVFVTHVMPLAPDEVRDDHQELFEAFGRKVTRIYVCSECMPLCRVEK